MNALWTIIAKYFGIVGSGMATPGLVIKKLSGGVLDTPLLVTKNGSKIIINSGYATYNDGGEIRMYQIPITEIDVSAYTNGTYYVCIKPKATNFEKGTISVTQSDNRISASSKGTFDRLRPGGWIILFNSVTSGDGGSTLNNGGAYRVAEVSAETATLDQVFPGITENNLKWKVGAAFPSNAVPSVNDDKCIFVYDDYDIVIQTSAVGLKLSQVQIASALAVNVIDKRQENLYQPVNNGANADDVVKGVSKDITTIEEKAQAGRVDKHIKNILVKGVRSGGNVSIDSNGIITITQITAWDGYGRLIIAPQNGNITLNCATLTLDGQIQIGTNYLHIYYTSPGGYGLYYSTSISTDPNHVLICAILDGDDATPRYSVVDRKSKPKFKGTSIKFEPKNPASDVELGEMMFYNNEYYLIYMKTDLSLGAFKVLNSESINTYINSIAKRERLRFALYPFENKDNWFFFGGVCAPTIVGYQFKVESMKIAVVDTETLNGTNHSVIDYMGALASPVVAKGTLADARIVSPTIPNVAYAGNSLLGVFFNGKVTGSEKRSIRLLINNATVVNIDFEQEGELANGGGGSPTSKLYVVEVTISENRDIIIHQQNED